MKKLFVSILLMGIVALASAGNNETKKETIAESTAVVALSGEVVDLLTHEALVGVKVTIEGTDQVVYTDFDGKYSFENLKPGKYNLVASYISYENIAVEDLEVSLNSNQVNISLKSSN